MFARPLRSRLLKQPYRAFSSSPARSADFTHVVIGAGAVGLAIARKLAERDGTSTLLIERHGSVGTETSSRNSEVIHAGLYYGADSLKTSLCLRGKEMLYDLCARHNIPHRNTGKWIVAQDAQQMSALSNLHAFATSVSVPTHFLSPATAHAREPSVRALAGVLESPTTGIIDSHALMAHLEGTFQTLGGELAFHTTVTNIEPHPLGGYEIYTSSSPSASSSSDPSPPPITTSTLINSAGLSAIPLSNLLLPPARHFTPFYAKGSYFSYASADPSPRPSTLVYPAPRPGLAGLGTHLTLDMAGRMRFGPDVEWVSDPTDLRVNESRLGEALDEIETFLPGIRREAVGLDYCGVRPKLGKGEAVAGGKGFNDFVIREEEGFEGFVNLLGIESPGLTSCLAIAEMVEGLLYR